MACTTPPPIVPSFGTLPNPNMKQDEFCIAVFNYYASLAQFVIKENELATWIKSTAEAACTAKDEAQISATNAANSAILAQQQVALAADQVDLAEQFADAAAISANEAQNSAINSQISATEALESAGIAAALANLQFGGFYVNNGRLFAAVNNLAVSIPYISNGRFYVEIL